MYGGIFMTSLLLTASLATALVYGVGGYEAAKGALLVGTVVALTLYLTRLYGPLTALSNVQVDVMTALVSFDRVFEVLDLRPMIEERPDAVVVARGPATIEFDHVDFSYPTAEEVSLASLESVAVLDQAPSQQVLHDVSFRVEPGQMAALVGPSGAGKTTISHLVPRLYDVTAGSIKVHGVDVRDATLGSLRAAIGVVTQDAHLFHETIRSNLLYAKPDATEEELREVLASAQSCRSWTHFPTGWTRWSEIGATGSPAVRSSASPSRDCCSRHPTSWCSTRRRHTSTRSPRRPFSWRSPPRSSGRTSIVIAHRLSTVREADVILVVDDGRIVERGSHDELLAADGLYAELYRTQFEHQGDIANPAVVPA